MTITFTNFCDAEITLTVGTEVFFKNDVEMYGVVVGLRSHRSRWGTVRWMADVDNGEEVVTLDVRRLSYAD